MAISETSKAPSRTIGLKPLLVGEYSAKSSVTRSDLIEPSFSADVQAWSPSNVRRRIATSVLLRLVDIDEAGLGQRLAHIVHVEPEHAGGELLALALLIGLALFALGRDLTGILLPDNHDAVVVGDDGIARFNIDSIAYHGDIDGAERRLDGALGRDSLRPHRKSHLAQRLHIAAAGIDDKPGDAARHQRGREQIAEHAVGIIGAAADHQNVARPALLDRDMDHPVVAGMRQHRHRGASRLAAGPYRTQIRLHQAEAAIGLVRGG